MIVYFETIDNNFFNIKTFDDVDELFDWVNFDIEEFIEYCMWFDEQKCFRDVIKKSNDWINIIAWVLNDNEYLNHNETLIDIINCFKKSEWYKNYMRTNKLNRIIYDSLF